MGDLAKDTAVGDLGDGRYRADLSEDWRIWGPNGGYVAAIALRAAGEAAAQARPASIAVHFLGVADFGPVDLAVTPMRIARNAQSLRVSMTQGDRAILEALVWAVADDVEALEHDEAPMPDVVSADDLPTMEERMAAADPPATPFPFWANIDNRGLQWSPKWPPDEPLPPTGRWWCRFRPAETFPDDRWVDACRSLVLLDTFGWPAANAAHAWRTEPGGEPHFIAPNIDLHATFSRFDPEERWLLVESTSPAGADGLLSARLAVWSAGGALLATGSQTMLARRVGGQIT